jgi:hypothetical protein
MADGGVVPAPNAGSPIPFPPCPMPSRSPSETGGRAGTEASPPRQGGAEPPRQAGGGAASAGLGCVRPQAGDGAVRTGRPAAWTGRAWIVSPGQPNTFYPSDEDVAPEREAPLPFTVEGGPPLAGKRPPFDAGPCYGGETLRAVPSTALPGRVPGAPCARHLSLRCRAHAALPNGGARDGGGRAPSRRLRQVGSR